MSLTGSERSKEASVGLSARKHTNITEANKSHRWLTNNETDRIKQRNLLGLDGSRFLSHNHSRAGLISDPCRWVTPAFIVESSREKSIPFRGIGQCVRASQTVHLTQCYAADRLQRALTVLPCGVTETQGAEEEELSAVLHHRLSFLLRRKTNCSEEGEGSGTI